MGVRRGFPLQSCRCEIPHMPDQAENLVCVALDGGLSECRRARGIKLRDSCHTRSPSLGPNLSEVKQTRLRLLVLATRD